MGKVHTQYNWFDAEAITPWNQLAQLNKTALAELTAQQIELERSVVAASSRFVSAAREAKTVNETLHAQNILLRKPYELGIEVAQKACDWFDKWAGQFLACWEKTFLKATG